METTNQAVLFTKPVHHLQIGLTPGELAARTREYFTSKGFRFVLERKLRGPDLAARDVIKKHYRMYSRAAGVASGAALELTDEAARRFESVFGTPWAAEAGRVLGSPALQQTKGITSQRLFELWNAEFAARRTCKLQDGVIVARLEALDCYCINAFYPAMEESFYHPATEMTYFVVEFDPGRISWQAFRTQLLGATDASRAEPGSFRAALYAEFRIDFPGRDNFVHGSAGPLEGLVERTLHETDFALASNPAGQHLERRGVTLEQFSAWLDTCPVRQLGAIFDATEGTNTADILETLDRLPF